MPSKKKKYNTRFPPARIKKIMQTDEDVGKVAAAVPVIISRALELFLESLVKTAGSVTSSRNAKTLTTSHVKACVLSNENFHFLKGLVDAYPDVQAEDEVSGSCNFEGQMPSNNSYHTNSGRGRRSKSSVAAAGPSHSANDDTETWSTEEDGECSTESCSETILPDHELCSAPTSSASSFPTAHCNTSYQPGSNLSLNYNPGQMYSNTSIDAFEDYDL